MWQAASGGAGRHSGGGRISVIIPALNEAARIGPVLERARSDAHEIIVVDGGSEDDTRAIAYSKGARVISAPRGRASQMNIGAQAATGDVLLFLHGDTMLPPHYAIDVQRTLLRKTVAGAFRFRLEGESRAYRVVEWGVRWRARLCRLPYGDQAIFLRADHFRAMGGFALLPIMEGFELLCRLRRLGPVCIARRAAVTSSRRWNDVGVGTTTWVNQLIVLGYRLGIDPARLARFYSKERKR
ncbi:MAG: glycosyltransferase family 2 protein [Lentisphaerae bacterium]|nr:glycosyltransferase family 2 protein [Lentisphaerota bacterium]